MQGKRHDLEGNRLNLEPGEYGKDPNGVWWARVPQSGDFYAGVGSLKNHEVVEHEDGTITVSPSILVTGHHDKQWHGYLERGVWREV